MSSVGYGDYHPSNYYEEMYLTFCQFFGLILFSIFQYKLIKIITFTFQIKGKSDSSEFNQIDFGEWYMKLKGFSDNYKHVNGL